jgi:hypothetical protein
VPLRELIGGVWIWKTVKNSLGRLAPILAPLFLQGIDAVGQLQDAVIQHLYGVVWRLDGLASLFPFKDARLLRECTG